MVGKGKKQEEQGSPSPSSSLRQPSSSRVQRSPPEATSPGEGRNKSNSKGGATSKSTGCSLCCVALLSILVAVAAVAGYAALVAFPTESEQLLREIDSHVRRIVRNLDVFVKTNLDRLLNRGPQATDENASEAQKSSDDERTDREQHDEGSLREERKEHGGSNAEEFDQIESQGKVWKSEESVDDSGENFEPEILVVEREDLGEEVFEEGVTEVVVVDDAAEFEERADEELEEEEEEEDEEDEELENNRPNDPTHRWEMAEGEEGATEDEAGKHVDESADHDVSEDGHEEVGRQESGHAAPEIEEEVSEAEDATEPPTAAHKTQHQAFPESVATETAEEASSVEALLQVNFERTKEEVDIQKVSPPELNVPVEGVPEEVLSDQEVLEEEAGSHGAPGQEDIPSRRDPEAEAVIPNEEEDISLE